MSIKIHYFKCPHCDGGIQVLHNQINCSIFRHGVYVNNKQMNPHEKEQICNHLFETNQIRGCGKPFRLIRFDNGIIAIKKCPYI